MPARRICVRLPDPEPLLEVTLPPSGTIVKGIQDLAMEAYNACNAARDFLRSMGPFFFGLGLPLCILGCVAAIIAIFDPESPVGIDPSAIPKMIEDCACLTGFTPFGYCSVLEGLVRSIIMVLDCIIGLMGDIIRLESQIASLSTYLDEASQFAAQCLAGNVKVLRELALQAMEPITDLFNSLEFLFKFIGIPFQALAALTGDSAAEVIDACEDLKDFLEDPILVAIDAVCP